MHAAEDYEGDGYDSKGVDVDGRDAEDYVVRGAAGLEAAKKARQFLKDRNQGIAKQVRHELAQHLSRLHAVARAKLLELDGRDALQRHADQVLLLADGQVRHVLHPLLHCSDLKKVLVEMGSAGGDIFNVQVQARTRLLQLL